MKQHAALAAACSAGFLWGTGALVVNLLIVRHGFSAETISFWRFVVGAVVLLAVFGRPSLWRALATQWPLVLGAGTAMAGYVLCWFLGIERIGAAVPTLIALCLPPVLVTLLAVARRHEQLDGPLVLILAGALAGTALIVFRKSGAGPVVSNPALAAGIGWSVLSALLYAGFTLVSGRLSTGLGAGPATTALTVVAAAVIGLSALVRPLAWPLEVAPEAWLLYLGVVTAALALLYLGRGTAHADRVDRGHAGRAVDRCCAVGRSARRTTGRRAVARRGPVVGQHLESGAAWGRAAMSMSIWERCGPFLDSCCRTRPGVPMPSA